MSIISDLHLGIYTYNDKEDKQTLKAVTGSKEKADNPLLKALLQKAVENDIEVCVEPEPEMKDYTPKSINMKMIEWKYNLRQTLKKTPHKNQNIIDFCHSISATPQSANSFKHIYSMKRSEGDTPKLMLFYNQSVNLDTGTNFRTARIGVEDIQTITFHTYLDWYITKNSFVGDIRETKNLFSFDNIVIDVDNHSDDIKTRTLNREIEKLIACLKAEDLDFPEFNVVYTGRGVHIWIGLVSFTARKDSMQRLYTTFCEKLCDIVKKVIQDNNISLDLDEGASKDKCRFVRLPFTTNTKVHRKTKFVKLTDRRYTVDELCTRFDIKGADKTQTRKKEDKLTSDKSGINYDMDFSALFIKRKNFIEKIVADCNGNCVGRRELLLHHYFNVCRQICGDEKAIANTVQLNMQFSDPLQKSALEAIFREKVYSYKSSTFLSGINATFEERRLYMNMIGRQAERDKAKEAKEERNQKIVELREKGCTQQQIADEVGCHVDTVANVLKKYKPEIKQETAKNTSYTKKPKLIKPLRKDIEKLTIELYKQSYKQKDIAKKLGIAESTVSEILKSFKKVELSPRDLEIIQLYKQGLSKAEIAKQVGCSRPTVYSVLNAYNDNTVTESKPDKPVVTKSDKKSFKIASARLKAPLFISKDKLAKLPEDERQVFTQILNTAEPKPDKPVVVPAPAEEKTTPEDFFRRIEKIQRERIERMLNTPIDKMFELEPETVGLPK